jgi:exosortase H (IPTLxxWG-CTERM-specific)
LTEKQSDNNTQNTGSSPEQSTARSVPGRIKAHLPIVKFVGITVVSLVIFFLLLKNAFFEKHFVAPYTEFVAASGRVALRLLGIQAHGTGSLIASPEFSVNIMNVCNGLEVTAIFFATVLGFPARWRYKMLGLGIGYPLIYLINIIRIVVLFILGFKMPDIFETVHYYYAQAFVIIATVGVWLIWVSLFSAYGSKSSHHISD